MLPVKTLSYLAFAWPQSLLPAETAVCDKGLPAKTVYMILLTAETLNKLQNSQDSLSRKLFIADGSRRRKQEISDSSVGAKFDGQSWQEEKISGLVYTLCRSSS